MTTTHGFGSTLRAGFFTGAAIATIAPVAPTASAKPVNAGGGSAPVSVTTTDVYVQVHSTGDEGSMSEAGCNSLGAAINSLQEQATVSDNFGQSTPGAQPGEAYRGQALRQQAQSIQDQATSSGCFVIY